MKECQSCGALTKNPKFCSRSCSARETNKVPKRKRTTSLYSCAKCEDPIPHTRKYCPKPECRPNYVDWTGVTLGEIRRNRKYQLHSRLRQLSRRNYLRSGGPQKCTICDYSKYFEVCHILDMWAMPDQTTAAEACSLENLIALCPNHHWEYDHGLLPHLKPKSKMTYK